MNAEAVPDKPQEDEYSLVLAEYRFKIKDKHGVSNSYVMREMDGLTRDQYLTGMSRKVKGSGEGSKIDDFQGLQEMLLSRCVYEVQSTGEEKLVPANVIQSWPTTLREKMHEKATLLSGLDPEAAKRAKNG